LDWKAKADGTKCMFMYRETKAGKYHKIHVVNDKKKGNKRYNTTKN
jgi:hypothetical protein